MFLNVMARVLCKEKTIKQPLERRRKEAEKLPSKTGEQSQRDDPFEGSQPGAVYAQVDD